MESGVIKSNSAQQTHALGRRLSAILASGDVVCLYGDLGTGKTCLVQGVCQGLECEDPAVSPSFTLVNEYPGPLPVYHLDCYRLKGAEELEQIGYEEYLGMVGVVIIEWAERITERLPEERLDIRLERVSDSERRITLEPRGRRWKDIIKSIRALFSKQEKPFPIPPSPEGRGQGVRP